MHLARNPDNRPVAPSSYRPTRFERLGHDGPLLLRAVPYMLVVFACLLLLFATLRRTLGYSSAFVVPLALVTTGAITWAGLRFANFAGTHLGRFILPTGDSTPYEHQFSREEALAARGDIAEALDAFESAIATIPIDAPSGINVRIRTAELCIGKGANPSRAAELLREVQRYPALAAPQDIYASNRLIDLLLGPLAQPSRALVELRRIADRYPDSNAAMHARAAIVTIKRQISDAEPGSAAGR